MIFAMEAPPLLSIDPQLAADLWVMGVGVLTNAACALLGCFLVLRRMSLLGDALSHAVLPGLVIGFLWGGSLDIGYLLIGALAAGLLTTFLTQAITRVGPVAADASMGVVFTSLFALGVLLINRYAQDVHLDADCLLYGLIEFVPIYTVDVAGYEIPRAALSIAPVFLFDVAVVLLFWKELKLVSFDAALATTLGFSAGAIHYLLMALVASTVVASFEAVGSILVIAMLIAPPATAHLLTDRLNRMVLIAMAVAAASAIVGFQLSVRFDTNTAGMMAVVAGGFYVLAMLFAPRYGALARLQVRLSGAQRIVHEDLLAMLYRLEELSSPRRLGAGEAAQALGGGPLARFSLWAARYAGEVVVDPTGLKLTDAGRNRAARLVRSHRLWEAYLVQFVGLPLDHVHDPAARMEHFIDRGLAQQIEADLEHVEHDPHGRAIPPAPGG